MSSDGKSSSGKNNAPDDDSPQNAFMQLGTQISVGGLAGACSGYALKCVAKNVAYGIGIAFVSAQLLAYKGYITIPWKKIGTEFKNVADLNADGKVDKKDALILWDRIKKVLVFGIPDAAGFLAGFSAAIRYF